MDRPALTKLLHAVEAGELDCVVVYEVDRLSRSLLDFTRMLSIFDKHKVSFVAVTPGSPPGNALEFRAARSPPPGWRFRSDLRWEAGSVRRRRSCRPSGLVLLRP